jgi:hypothetical protein
MEYSNLKKVFQIFLINFNFKKIKLLMLKSEFVLVI